MAGMELHIWLQQQRSVQAAQLAVAAWLAVDYWWLHIIATQAAGWFLSLSVLLVVIALLIPVGEHTSTSVKRLLVSVYFSMAAVVLLFATPIFGPYSYILLVLVLISVLWFRTRGFVVSLCASYAIILAAAWLQAGALAPWWQAALVLMAGLFGFGLLFERVISRYRSETHEHETSSRDYIYERNRLLSLINSMADAVIATDGFGKISLYNGAALDLLDTNQNLQKESIRKLLRLFDSEDNEVDIIAEARKQHAPIIREDVCFYAQDNSTVDLYISVSPVTVAGSDRHEAGFIMVLRDITHQKTLDEQRDEFISVASHELRTPIAIAEANISTAMMPKFAHKLTKEGQKLLEQAHDNVVFLSTLINDLHVLAKAEQGRIDIQHDTLDPASALEDFADNYRKQIKDKDLELEVDVAHDTPAITTSYDALREIMQNFITNAIKYTQKGIITLRAYPDPNSDGVIFAVTDTGIGISAADQRRIFEKFYRSEDYRTRQNGGTGLGLYIIKRLCERIGGRIWFESKLNKGSTFYCALPREIPAEATTD